MVRTGDTGQSVIMNSTLDLVLVIGAADIRLYKLSPVPVETLVWR